MKKSNITTVLTCLLILSASAAVIFAILFINEKKKTNIDRLWNAEAVSADTAAADGCYNSEYMQEAIDNAIHAVRGPVGAVITKKNGELIVSTCNQNSDVQALNHAEICAITEAQRILGTRDLSDCVLYTSSEPCLMCACAIANVKLSKVYYAASFKDSKSFGFDDELYYDEISNGKTLTEWVYVDEKNKLEPFEEHLRGKQNKQKETP